MKTRVTYGFLAGLVGLSGYLWFENSRLRTDLQGARANLREVGERLKEAEASAAYHVSEPVVRKHLDCQLAAQVVVRELAINQEDVATVILLRRDAFDYARRCAE